MIEPLLSLIVMLVIGGLIWYLITRLPLPAPIKTVIEVVVILILIIVLWQWFLPLGHIRG